MGTGRPFVVAAPSGAGKTSLVKALVDTSPNIKVATSHTTRPKRANEVDKLNYFFVDEPHFLRMIENSEFLEWARVFGFLYGTSKKEADRILTGGDHLILEIDWQGTAQIRLEVPHATTIFILPPSLGSLRDRLQQRAQDDQHTVDQRMSAAIDEISHYMDFDYLIVNDDFDQALSEMGAVVSGQGDHLRQAAQRRKLAPLISALQG
ncbi:MAG: guanylate kinase [Gammaproteobacteria bacterium]|nr:guanylate kinase [Gammaproteobacteria bacterium]